MKVIIYDDESSIKEFKSLIKIIPFNIKIDETDNYQNFLNMYDKESYDAVFINTNEKQGVQLKNEIIKINSSQRIISINNSLECSDPLGCDHCKENTNSYRIFKPFHVDSLVKSLKNIKCDTNYSDGKLTTKLHIFSKAFNDLEFDEKAYKFIIKNNYNDSIFSHTSSLINLVEVLNNNKIDFIVEDDHIQILK